MLSPPTEKVFVTFEFALTEVEAESLILGSRYVRFINLSVLWREAEDQAASMHGILKTARRKALQHQALKKSLALAANEICHMTDPPASITAIYDQLDPNWLSLNLSRALNDRSPKPFDVIMIFRSSIPVSVSD